MIFNARNKKITCIAFIALFFYLFSPSAFAESQSLSVSPLINYFDRGDQTEQKFELKINNSSDKNQRVKVYSSPYAIIDDNFKTSFEENDRTKYNEITEWISFKNDDGSYEKEIETEIEDNTEKIIKYKIKFKESEKREQYCVIFVEIIPEDGVNSLFRIASFVVAHDAEKEERLEVQEFTEKSFNLNNTGENSSKISYSFGVYSIFGKKLFEENAEKIIYPESKRSFSFDWAKMPDFGIFRQKLSLNTINGMQEKEVIIFRIPTYLKVIMVLLLTFIIFMLIIRIKNRKECGDSSVQNKNNQG